MKKCMNFLYRAFSNRARLATNSLPTLVVAGLAAVSFATAAVLLHAVSNSQAFV
jgi:hypothetical protein